MSCGIIYEFTIESFNFQLLIFNLIRGYGGIGSFENERTLWVMKRVRKGAETRRIASKREQGDYVSRVTRGAAAPNQKLNMRVWRNWQTR